MGDRVLSAGRQTQHVIILGLTPPHPAEGSVKGGGVAGLHQTISRSTACWRAGCGFGIEVVASMQCPAYPLTLLWIGSLWRKCARSLWRLPMCPPSGVKRVHSLRHKALGKS